MSLINPPLVLPGVPLSGVYGLVSLAATPDGLVTVGWSITHLCTLEQLALGALPPGTREERTSDADALLGELWDSVASLVDWPPFP